MDIKGIWNFIRRPTFGGTGLVITTDSVDTLDNIDLTGIATDQGVKWDGDDLVATDFPSGGGFTVVASGESEGSSGTSSSTWLQKLTINHTFEAGQDYVIFWQCEWQNTSTSGDCDMRVQRNNIASSVADMRQEPQDGGSDQWRPISGYRRFTGLTGSQTFDMDYRNNGEGTASIRKARMMLVEAG